MCWPAVDHRPWVGPSVSIISLLVAPAGCDISAPKAGLYSCRWSVYVCLQFGTEDSHLLCPQSHQLAHGKVTAEIPQPEDSNCDQRNRNGNDNAMWLLVHAGIVGLDRRVRKKSLHHSCAVATAERRSIRGTLEPRGRENGLQQQQQLDKPIPERQTGGHANRDPIRGSQRIFVVNGRHANQLCNACWPDTRYSIDDTKSKRKTATQRANDARRPWC
jgi:hypothetical protein